MTGNRKDRPPPTADAVDKDRREKPVAQDERRSLADALADLDEQDKQRLSDERNRVIGSSPKPAK